MERYQVTFASFNKITFCSDYSDDLNIDNMRLFLENEVYAIIGKLQGTAFFRKGVIETIASDINSSEGIIYFEVILSPNITPTSLVDAVTCLNSLLINLHDN